MLLIAAALVMQTSAEPMNLVCFGAGVSRGIANSYGTVSSGVDSAAVQMQHQTREAFSDQVNLRIEGESGKIRVPNGVMPLWTYGGDDGWYPLKKIEVEENEIRAKFSLNFMNNPEVRLDRLTGQITIRGKAGNFNGQCEKYDPSTVQRKF